MQLTPEELSDLHPTLYHVTFACNVESVLRHGLKSAQVLRQEAGWNAVGNQPARPYPQPLPTGATLNDQLPMCGRVWEKCRLPNGMLRPCEWFSYLDQHVFFWTTEENLANCLKVRRRLQYESTVFELETKLLLQDFEKSVALSAQNTGGPYSPNPTPRERFAPLATFPFRDHARRRSNRKKAVVELVLTTRMNKPELLTLMPEKTWPI